MSFETIESFVIMRELKPSLFQRCRAPASLRVDVWGDCWESPAGREVLFSFPACFHRNINYASTRIPVNIGVKSYEGCPKTEAQGGIGGEKLAVPEETWPRCGSACNAWARMHPNFSLWLLIRNWWWNAPRNGKLFFIIIIVVIRVLTVVQLLKTHEKCVCLCVYAGMLSSFMVTHTKSC